MKTTSCGVGEELSELPNASSFGVFSRLCFVFPVLFNVSQNLDTRVFFAFREERALGEREEKVLGEKREGV